MAKATIKKSKEEKLMENIAEVETQNEVETMEEEAVITVSPVDEQPTLSITVDESAMTPKASKLVRVRVIDKFKCHIGGEWYYFEKNKVYSVPEEVKDILMQGNKLLPM